MPYETATQRCPTKPLRKDALRSRCAMMPYEAASQRGLAKGEIISPVILDHSEFSVSTVLYDNVELPLCTTSQRGEEPVLRMFTKLTSYTSKQN
ncbi:hypothetical protein POVWA2_014070 [Plasmodium ovale wallikeri]|uniref:Uncharacterized protein n=1 Tax=Plasmodium ovale wallikeri TaxID=864142 RepID=A0A1A8YP40_PLAOA|nr:hypothetical protein POVWA1_014220 [Plasmodium ovale wallikeri]SBT33301.1 hypothetical protein POVWA2_014070 [Plasmodium ovale wallikeri]